MEAALPSAAVKPLGAAALWTGTGSLVPLCVMGGRGPAGFPLRAPHLMGGSRPPGCPSLRPSPDGWVPAPPGAPLCAPHLMGGSQPRGFPSPRPSPDLFIP